MNTFDYQFFHIAMVIIIVANLLYAANSPQNIAFKILYGLNTVFLLISGLIMIQLAGLNPADISHYPLWLWVKILCWMLITIIPPILNKRAPKLMQKISLVFILIILFAAYLGIYKI
ncbi:MAG: hypothetical protein CME62_09930 [Halobacteriovoraceae bacterium]|nr:hypothetical protein [Halobacteriovoraceae bacterium]|tara:strand:+ start:10762 stop:11112 length:351 start_codon:yes stop_codon:yes gene_type:complete